MVDPASLPAGRQEVRDDNVGLAGLYISTLSILFFTKSDII